MFFSQGLCLAQADLVEKALILKDYAQAIEIAEKLVREELSHDKKQEELIKKMLDDVQPN